MAIIFVLNPEKESPRSKAKDAHSILTFDTMRPAILEFTETQAQDSERVAAVIFKGTPEKEAEETVRVLSGLSFTGPMIAGFNSIRLRTKFAGLGCISTSEENVFVVLEKALKEPRAESPLLA